MIARSPGGGTRCSRHDRIINDPEIYSRRGYAECGRVPDFYGEGDAKVIYVKRLRTAD